MGRGRKYFDDDNQPFDQAIEMVNMGLNDDVDDDAVDDLMKTLQSEIELQPFPEVPHHKIVIPNVSNKNTKAQLEEITDQYSHIEAIIGQLPVTPNKEPLFEELVEESAKLEESINKGKKEQQQVSDNLIEQHCESNPEKVRKLSDDNPIKQQLRECNVVSQFLNALSKSLDALVKPIKNWWNALFKTKEQTPQERLEKAIVNKEKYEAKYQALTNKKTDQAKALLKLIKITEKTIEASTANIELTEMRIKIKK